MNMKWKPILSSLLLLVSASATWGQGIIYVPAPINSPSDIYFQWDSFGTRVEVYSPFSIIINGQTVLTFSSLGDGIGGIAAQPSTFGFKTGFTPLGGNLSWRRFLQAGRLFHYSQKSVLLTGS